MKYDGKLIATIIRERRLELNYSQDYVASKLSMSQNAYSKLEQGQTGVTLGKFMVICETLDLNTADFMLLYAKRLN